MAKKTKMTSEELRALIAGEIRHAVGFLGGDLSAQRAESMKRYLAEPYDTDGSLVDRSRIVSSDVADAVEWILPSLLKIFASGDDVVQFAAQGPEDEKVAAQATEYANWIFLRDNPGFLILYTWFKDALIQKNGIVKCWWEVADKKKKERYQGLSDDAFAILLQEVEDQGDIEIVAHTEYPAPYTPPPGAVQGPQPMGGPMPPQSPPMAPGGPQIAPQGAPMMPGPGAPTPMQPPPGMTSPMPEAGAAPASPMLHDVVVEKTKEYGCVKVEPVPPEEFLISPEAKVIQDARFVGHRVRKTISDLIAEGYDREQVEGLGSEGNSMLSSEEALARLTNADEIRVGQVTTATNNPQMREVWVVEGYLLVDYDGDGIAERRKIIAAGTGWEILKQDGEGDNIEWEGPVPFASLTPIIMPHKFFGRSVAETIEDLAKVKTTLTRQLLDALYIANNPRHEVFEDGVVDPEEILLAKPGGIVRKNTLAQVMIPIMTTPIAGEALQGLEYVDTVLENRTGVTKYNQGLDADSLNKTAHGVSQIMSAAQQRIELIARVFAETGVKELFRLILNLVTAHQQEARVIRLRETWVPMDPREWDSEMDVTINVGLGTGNKEQQAMLLNQLIQIQGQFIAFQQGIDGPLVKADNLYKSVDKFISASGIAKNAEGFFTDPTGAPPKPPAPNPEMVKVQMQAQLAAQKQQSDQQQAQLQLQLQEKQAIADQQIAVAKQQSDSQAAMLKLELEAKKIEMTHQLKVQELNAKFQLDQMSLQATQAMEREKAHAQIGLEREKFGAQAELEHDRFNQTQSFEREKAGLPKGKTPTKTIKFLRDKPGGPLEGAVVEET